MTRPSARRVASRFAAARTKRAGQTWYHLTDKADFKLNPKHTPEDNSVSIVDRSGQPGIYLGSDVEKWVNGYGYWRPFVVEFDVDPTVKEDPGVHGRWGGELFVPATSFDKISIKRVIPIDAWARENYGDFGWVEAFHLRRFDTGEPIETAGFGRLLNPPKGYRYPGPDVRQMPAGDVKRLKKDLRDFRKGARMASTRTAAPFVDEGMVGDNWGSSASGMLVTDGERVLLLKRSSLVEDPNLWGIPGGAIPVDYDTHKRKDAKRSALDEAREEMGGIPSGSVIGKHVFRKPSGFSFTTFVWETDPESLDRFTPRLNWEHTDWDLFDLDGIKPRGIHPGVIWVLKRMGG